jgi:GNAT superfamily N-acetyltransferase
MTSRPPPPAFQVELRPATEADYAFAERLYVETMKPLLQRLEAWDEAELLGRFRGSFDVTHVRIIRVDDADVGFIQISETDAQINLDQIHLRKHYRSRGIGSQLIGGLLRAAAARDKALSLAVVRGNRALALYQRLGFSTVGTDATKLYMRAGQSITAGSACQP